MATAEIVIKGTDNSAAAVKSATENVKRLREAKRQLNDQTKVLNNTFNSFGTLASTIGSGTLGALVGQVEAFIISSRKMEAGLKNSAAALLGFGAAGAALGANLAAPIYDFFTEKAAKALHEKAELMGIIDEAMNSIVETADKEAAAYLKINLRINEQARALMRLKTLSAQEFISGADALNRQREVSRVQYVRTADQQIAKDRKEADDAYEKAQALILQNQRKQKDADFQKYLDNLDAQIQAEVDAKKQIEDQVNADADAAERAWEEQNTGLIDQMKVREQLFNTSLSNMGQALRSFSASAAIAVSEGIGNAVANIATGAMTAKEAFKQFGKEMIGLLAKTAAQLVINAVLAQALQSSFAVTSAVIGQAVASAWAPAAAMVSLASYGANAIPAAAGIIATTTLAKGLAIVGAQAHGGVDYVPQDQTVLLQQGERVIKRNQNERLMEVLEGGGGGGGGQIINLTVLLDGAALFKAMGQASRDGRLTISARAVA